MVYNVRPSLMFLYIKVSSSSASVIVCEHLLTASLMSGYIQVVVQSVIQSGMCSYIPKALLETDLKDRPWLGLCQIFF